VKEIVASDFEIMNTSYEMDGFPADPSPQKCFTCSFASVCPDSRHKDQVGVVDNPSDPINDMLVDIVE
jgi:hypothetical protein